MDDAKKKWWLIGGMSAFLILALGVFLWIKFSPKVITKDEYIKEVIIQKTNFDGILGDFLDKAGSYNDSIEARTSLQKSSDKIKNFIINIEIVLGPKVPVASRTHFNSMISAYKVYGEAIDLYLAYLPMDIKSSEREVSRLKAETKLAEAQNVMMNLKA